ncbi:MAG: FAD-dependent oxidoreductase [Candidatus Hodarchaeales archaeon]|jgi:heterodisulfide reductase subunit A
MSEKSVVVIGAGIAGIQASLDLGDMGIKVILVEKEPCIGGRMAQLDKTFPTLDCSICILAPKLSECYRHPNITLYTLAEVQKVSGTAGNFSVEVLKHPRYVKEKVCTNCGDCGTICPVRGCTNFFDADLMTQSASQIAFPAAVPPVYRINPDKCLYLNYGICGLCYQQCGADAIDFTQKEEVIPIDNVGAVIVATGVDLAEDIHSLNVYGYQKYDNVVTAMEFERLICASGPQHGHLKTLTDGRTPKKIAFLQCIDSRNQRTQDYCSSVCCMYTTKEAMVAYEHDNELESYVFYIDMRAGGKGFQKFLQRGEQEYNIKYIKSKISHIEVDEDKSPIISYEDMDTSEVKQMKFDLVVLATCIIPSLSNEKVSKILGVDLDKNRFIKTDPFFPAESTVEGIYTCGCAREPMDIPRSVAEASGAAARAAELVKGGS